MMCKREKQRKELRMSLPRQRFLGLLEGKAHALHKRKGCRRLLTFAPSHPDTDHGIGPRERNSSYLATSTRMRDSVATGDVNSLTRGYQKSASFFIRPGSGLHELWLNSVLANHSHDFLVDADGHPSLL